MLRARWLSFRWSPERQEIACDGERFAHPAATSTGPSHDVAHLLAAASGLPWKPQGTRDEVSFSECNAVFLEHLAVRSLDAAAQGSGKEGSVLEDTLKHVRWFVETHYAPFPVSFDEALGRFRDGLDAEAVVRLSPVLLRTRVFELEHPDFRERTFGGAFSSGFAPNAEGRLAEARGVLARQLAALDTKRVRRHRRAIRATDLAIAAPRIS